MKTTLSISLDDNLLTLIKTQVDAQNSDPSKPRTSVSNWINNAVSMRCNPIHYCMTIQLLTHDAALHELYPKLADQYNRSGMGLDSCLELMLNLKLEALQLRDAGESIGDLGDDSIAEPLLLGSTHLKTDASPRQPPTPVTISRRPKHKRFSKNLISISSAAATPKIPRFLPE